MYFFSLLHLAHDVLPHKDFGNWIDVVFDWCVDLLLALAAALGISYNAVNVIIFCVVWPAFTLFLIGLVLYQHIKIRRLTRRF
jgi:hypothetical protein